MRIGHCPLDSPKGLEEVKMLNCYQNSRHGKAVCAVCDSQFGLVRYYSWRTPLYSRKCVDRLRARSDTDRNWIGWLKIGFDQPSENRARAS